MRLSQLSYGFAALACLALLPVTIAHGQQTNDFGWSITPYLWATETRVDLTLRDADIGTGEISFGDLLDVPADIDPRRAGSLAGRRAILGGVLLENSPGDR